MLKMPILAESLEDFLCFAKTNGFPITNGNLSGNVCDKMACLTHLHPKIAGINI